MPQRLCPAMKMMIARVEEVVEGEARRGAVGPSDVAAQEAFRLVRC
jgi:hypothetical protein